jgi:nitrous oxidase accessory protein NosD
MRPIEGFPTRSAKSLARQTFRGFALLMLLVLVAIPAYPEAESGPEDYPPSPAVSAGIGTRFETVDSEVIDAVLESSDSVSVHLQAVTGSIALVIFQHAAVPSVRLRLSGLEPVRTYFLTVDDFRNPMAMVASSEGVIYWDQDVTVPHTIFVSETTHTITLNDSGFNVPVGTWDSLTRTATLSQNVSESIQIVSSNITLDGAGRTVTASPGITVQGSEIRDVTIKNLVINSQRSIYGVACKNLRIENVTSNASQYGYGFTTGDDGVVILNCTVLGGQSGIDAYSTGSYSQGAAPCTIQGCTIRDATIGLWIKGTRRLHTMIDNTFIGNRYHFYANHENIGFTCIAFAGVNRAGPSAADLRPILYYNGPTAAPAVIDGTLPDYNAAAIWLIGCENTTIRNMNFSHAGQAIGIYGGKNIVIENVTCSESMIPIDLTAFEYAAQDAPYWQTGTVTVRNCLLLGNIYERALRCNHLTGGTLDRVTFQDNRYGAKFNQSSGWVIRNCTFMGNDEGGLEVGESGHLQIEDNVFADNGGCGYGFMESYTFYLATIHATTLRRNAMTNNDWSFGYEGDYSRAAANDIDASNTVDGKNIIVVRDLINPTIGPADNPGAVYLLECSGARIEDVTLSRNRYGLRGWRSMNTTVARVTFDQNDFNMRLTGCSGVSVTSCQLKNPWGCSVYTEDSDNLLFEGNELGYETLCSQAGEGFYIIQQNLVNAQGVTLRNNEIDVGRRGVCTNFVTDLVLEGNTVRSPEPASLFNHAAPYQTPAGGSIRMRNNRFERVATSWMTPAVRIYGSGVVGQVVSEGDVIDAPGGGGDGMIWSEQTGRAVGSVVTAGRDAMVWDRCSGSTMTECTLTGGRYALDLQRTNNNSIVNNNLIGGVTSTVSPSSGQTWSQPLPVGGNYWSAWSTPDANGDGIVDTPYNFSLGVDSSPYPEKWGWRHNITSTHGAGGTVEPGELVKAAPGSTRTLRFTPDPGYMVTDVAVDNGSVGSVPEYVFSNIDADHAAHATFGLSNQPPVLPDVPDQATASEGVLFSLSVAGSDPDGPSDVLTYSLDPGAPEGMTIDPATGLISWAPSELQGGTTYPVTVRVHDSGDPALEGTETFAVQVLEVNSPPEIVGVIGDKTVNELETLTFTVSATDPDLPANTLTFQLDPGSPDGASITDQGVFTWTPTELQGPGDYPITIRVRDGVSPVGEDFETITVHVREVATPIDGTIINLCGGNISEVEVRATDAGGVTQTTNSDAEGHYHFEMHPGQITVTVVPPADYAVAGDAAVTIDHQGTSTLNFNLNPLVILSGVVRGCEGPIENVTVDVVDGAQEQYVAYTSSNGSYSFQGLIPGEGNLSYILPLGYRPVDPASEAIAVDLACTMTQDISLSCRTASGPSGGMGYWKHQVQVYKLHRGSAQESEIDITVNYPNAIFTHFYENQLSSIDVAGITYRVDGGMVPLDLDTMYATLWVVNSAPMLERAKQNYMSTMLNIASGRLLVRDVISEDGLTLSQAIQYIADLINDGQTFNDELAKGLAESINGGEIVAAGIIPSSYETVPYREEVVLVPISFRLGDAIPNPFTQATTIVCDLPKATTLQVVIYDVAGRAVRTLVNDTRAAGNYSFEWDGRDDGGHHVGCGIYFYAMRAGEYQSHRRLTVLR